MSVDYSRLPEHMQEGARLYIENKIPPGSFLTAVLENNLVDAFGKADEINLARLRDWTMWLYWECPRQAWGSREKVDAWLKQKPIP